jgi:hypothetical protein
MTAPTITATRAIAAVRVILRMLYLRTLSEFAASDIPKISEKKTVIWARDFD